MSETKPISKSFLSLDEQRMLDAVEAAHLKARIQELESELASCRECRANLDCLSRGAVPVRDDGALKRYQDGFHEWRRLAETGAERIREQDALLAQAADILNCTSGLNAMDLGAKITAYRLAQQKATQPKDTAK